VAKKINTIYIANHSHTDLGFTDHQDVVMRQHVEFIDKAIAVYFNNTIIANAVL
jgi:hypothetical protein